ACRCSGSIDTAMVNSLLKLLRRKSFLILTVRGTGCGIPATGTQEGDGGRTRNHGFAVIFWVNCGVRIFLLRRRKGAPGKEDEDVGSGVVGRFVRGRRCSGWLHPVDDRTGVGSKPDPSR